MFDRCLMHSIYLLINALILYINILEIIINCISKFQNWTTHTYIYMIHILILNKFCNSVFIYSNFLHELNNSNIKIIKFRFILTNGIYLSAYFKLVIYFSFMKSFILKLLVIVQILFYTILCIFIHLHSISRIFFCPILSSSCNLIFFVFMADVILYAYYFNGNTTNYNQYLSAKYIKTISFLTDTLFKRFLNFIFITYIYENG